MHHYLHSAAPRAKLEYNINVVREFQCTLSPYPTAIGYYNKVDRPHNEVPVEKLRKHPSILKCYKSCPVSPVHEEADWSSVYEVTSENKRLSYENDAKTILNTIHSDTEKMIAEITLKYGDLNEYKLNKNVLETTHENAEEFSSDSLEECSLNEILRDKCKKHSKPVRRTKSDYQIGGSSRNISLADILNEADRNEQNFYNSCRHSSASFFLENVSHQKSQESLLSDDLCGSYCNSMESVFSDDSECKSAPLDIFFARNTPINTINELKFNEAQASSKSYGSSPNAGSYFDYFIQQELEPTLTNYGINALELRMPTSITCPSFSDDEFIPTLSSKTAQYSSGIKSLTNDFAQHRKSSNTNPLYECTREKMYRRADIFGFNNIKKSVSLNFAKDKSKRNSVSFENERLAEYYKKSSTLEPDYIAHKPPVANRRSSSVRNRKRQIVNKESFVVIDHIMPEQPEEIKSFELYVTEKELAENVDSFESISKLESKANMVESLDPPERDDAPKIHFTDSPEYTKFKDIERKIDIINKLVKLEEKKLERERIMKELRMTPFQCDSSRKGYVKSLSKNYDRLSYQNAEHDYHNASQLKRNNSLPDVLEGAKFTILSNGLLRGEFN